jgi:hypothetical protein
MIFFPIMRSFVLSLIALFASAPVYGAINQSCKEGSENEAILHIHGRLAVYNGGKPNLRIWQTGTHHLFGIFSDTKDLRCTRSGACEGDDDTKLPSSLEGLNLLRGPIYADFDIRPLEPFHQGRQQAACIVDARNIVLEPIQPGRSH